MASEPAAWWRAPQGILAGETFQQINGPVERAGQPASGLRFADPRPTTWLELERADRSLSRTGDGSRVRSRLAAGGKRIRTVGPGRGKCVQATSAAFGDAATR